ncbi:XRE family transcriptional regulator [Ferruginibacter sp. SUN106]|uniref:XRE family transcriptional regulator n=1 Tax=Ferruginibacter sp. SUN106 TaxID=2978348 RepID=UPI003D3626A1
MSNTIHHGRNVKRFREMLGIKQEALAHSMGEDWNQKKISLLESKEVIDDALLEQVAGIFKVPAVAIRNFDEERAVYNIQNNYEGSNTNASHINTNNTDCTINYTDRWIEALDKMEKIFERLLQVEKEKNELLQKLLDLKK